MDARTIIQKLGGPSAAAVFWECSPAAVSQWKRMNKLPNARLLHVKAAHPEWFETAPTVEFSTPLIESRMPTLLTRETVSPAGGMPADFGEFGEPRTGLDRRECNRRALQESTFGAFGEPRDGDRREGDRRRELDDQPEQSA